MPNQNIVLVTLLVPEYDEAIAFFVSTLGFDLLEDTSLENGKRWVRVSPHNSRGTNLLLARAVTPEQIASIGNQTGGRVGFFLTTDEFWIVYKNYLAKGLHFEEEPRKEEYGYVVVFRDIYGNRWDLLEGKANEPVFASMVQSQMLAALMMLDTAIKACPPNLWQARLWDDKTMQPDFSEFWYIAFHALFWFDLYLEGKVEGFFPPPPFNLDELDPSGKMPDRVYSRLEILTYLAYCREKLLGIVGKLTIIRAEEICHFPWKNISYGELLLDMMRHTQEHAAQLAMFLGNNNGELSHWVTKVDN